MARKKNKLVKKAGIVDGVLVLVLVIWIVTMLVMFNKMLPLSTFQTTGLASITAFSAFFSSILLAIIAIILEAIRKELK